MGVGFRVEVSELYREWRLWCDAHGRKEPGTEETFGRDLRAAVPSLTKPRTRTPEGRLFVYSGLRLCEHGEPEEDTEPPEGHPGHRGHPDQALHTMETRNRDTQDAGKGCPEEACKEIGNAMPVHGDHGDHPDRPPARRRFKSDDTPHEWRA